MLLLQVTSGLWVHCRKAFFRVPRFRYQKYNNKLSVFLTYPLHATWHIRPPHFFPIPFYPWHSLVLQCVISNQRNQFPSFPLQQFFSKLFSSFQLFSCPLVVMSRQPCNADCSLCSVCGQASRLYFLTSTLIL